MATPPPYSKKSHFTPPHPKKTSKSSPSNFLGKSLIVILVLVIIPLFPSQAPDFIRQSIFPELWELLHLMFIGIAVCYGLFSKRSHTVDLETHPRFDGSHAYLSGISNVSSIFDNGHENLYGSYGRIGMPESRGFQNLEDECVGKGNSELGGDERCRSFVIRNECQGRKFSQTLMNSQHFIGESVVVANRYHRTNPLSFVDNKPLGLPVRSLRSRVADTDKPDIDSEVDKTRILSGSAGACFRGNDSNVVKIRGMAPVNSETEFEEAAANMLQGLRPRRRELGEGTRRVNKPSSQYCRSQSASEFEFRQFRHFRSTSFQQPPSSQSSSKTSSPGTSTPTSSPSQEQQPNFEGKMDLEEFPVSISRPTEISVHGDVAAESSSGSSAEMNMQMEDEFDDLTNVSLGSGREEVSYAKPPSHSIGESDHEYIKSWSFWHPTPSETNSKSSSPTKHSPILSASPELPNIEMHDHQEKKDIGAQSISVSHPIVTSINGEAKSISSRNQWPSSTEMNPQRPLRDSHKDAGKDVREDSSLIGKRIGSLDSHVKPSPSPRPKVLLRGKSVRTIRASRLEDDLKSNDSASVKSRSHCSPVEPLSSVKSVNGGGCENGPVNTGKGDLDAHPFPNSAFSPKQNGRKEASVVGDVLESREDSVSVLNNSDMSSDDEKPGSYLVDDVELGSEVDRKAGEFIAKFREQIRLQKVESFRRSTT